MSPSAGLNVGLDVGVLGSKAEGMRHWTFQTFRALIRDNPHHHFTLVWPLHRADPQACALLAGPNTTLFSVRPRTLWRRVGRRLRVLDEQARAAHMLGRLDVMYWGAETEVVFPWLHLAPRVPKVVTLFDAVPLVMAETQPAVWIESWRRHVARAQELGSWWLAISEHAHGELVWHAGMDPGLGTFVHCGHNFDGSGGPVPDGPLPADLAGRLGDSPYVLTVGTLEPRKNHARLFRAFRALAARPAFAGWKLVAVGGEGWLHEGILAEASASPGVVLAGRRSHEELAALYRHATAFAYPSLYEGFGIPVAEAMSFGLPVLTSNTSSLPEVAGDAAVLVDPTDPDAIRDGLARLMGSPDLRAKLAALAKERAGKFRWDRSAREVMRFLERVAADRPADEPGRGAAPGRGHRARA
jgi:glycosyltransferase involved in cell wall biosynthesis